MRLTRRQFTQGLAAGAALSGMPFNGGAAMANTMADAASALLAALTAEQLTAARLPFTTEARADWHFFPRSRPGVTVEKMPPSAKIKLRALLSLLFSTQGLAKVDGVIQLEKVLYDLSFFSFFRNPGNYAIVFFGEPSSTTAWGWRFEGHHLSISATVVAGLGVAATPAFFGANPQTVSDNHEHKGLRVLAAEEDLAFQLVQGLGAEALSQAMITEDIPEDIISGPGREASLQEISGLAVGAMNSAGRNLAESLLNAYVANMTKEIAEREIGRVREAGWETLQFRWAGATERGKPHYYRLHGPTVLIEYDNSQGGANHVHSVWHNPTNFLGADMLKRHYASGGH